MTQQQIDRAKQIDFVQLIESLELPFRQESGHIKIRCPWHEEDTPSCAIYEDHYYCFGCSEHGDQIGFIQKIMNCSFVEAITFLNKI